MTYIFKQGIILCMRRILTAILILLSLCQVSLAQSPEDKRRVEEEKRGDLRLSEFYLPDSQVITRPADKSNENAYFAQLLTKEIASLSDAYQTLVILMGVSDQFSNLDSQYDFLMKNGIVLESIGTKMNYNEPLRKGAAAYMFATAMKIKGGIILRSLGLNQRYAFKELVYQEIMFPGNVHDVMSGQELILTLTQAADYMTKKRVNSQ